MYHIVGDLVNPAFVPYLSADVDIWWLSRYCTSGCNLSYFIRSTAITIEAWKKSAHSWKIFGLPSWSFVCLLTQSTFYSFKSHISLPPENVLYNAPHRISVNARQLRTRDQRTPQSIRGIIFDYSSRWYQSLPMAPRSSHALIQRTRSFNTRHYTNTKFRRHLHYMHSNETPLSLAWSCLPLVQVHCFDLH